LAIRKQRVIGGITNIISDLSLKDFRKLDECTGDDLRFATVVSYRDQHLQISLLHSSQLPVFFSIFDIQGCKLDELQIESVDNQIFEWSIDELPVGIYILYRSNAKDNDSKLFFID
jgi:hypothetical protein